MANDDPMTTQHHRRGCVCNRRNDGVITVGTIGVLLVLMMLRQSLHLFTIVAGSAALDEIVLHTLL